MKNEHHSYDSAIVGISILVTTCIIQHGGLTTCVQSQIRQKLEKLNVSFLLAFILVHMN